MSVSPISLRTAVFPRSSLLDNALLVMGGTVFIAGLAQIALPIPGSPIPVTGQTLGVLLVGTSYGAGLGFTTLLTYLLVGIAGAAGAIWRAAIKTHRDVNANFRKLRRVYKDFYGEKWLDHWED